MRIAIVGAGAMGGIFGSCLHEGGLDATLVDVVQPLVDTIAAKGLTIDRKGEVRTVPVRATTDPSSVGAVDAVVFFTKCYHTAAAAELARPLVGPETTIVSLQNGWGNGDTLAAAFDPERIVVGVTYNSGTVRALGEIAHTGIGITYVGPFRGVSLERAEAVAAALRAGGLDAEPLPAILTEIWKKLVLNAATLPTAALSGMHAGALGEPGVMRDLVDATAREAVAVARAQGYDIDIGERIGFIHDLVVKAGPGKPSMLQDFEAGRRTEIDVVNGAVVRAADERGIDVPVNRALLALVKGWEKMRGLDA